MSCKVSAICCIAVNTTLECILLCVWYTWGALIVTLIHLMGTFYLIHLNGTRSFSLSDTPERHSFFPGLTWVALANLLLAETSTNFPWSEWLCQEDHPRVSEPSFVDTPPCCTLKGRPKLGHNLPHAFHHTRPSPQARSFEQLNWRSCLVNFVNTVLGA